MPARLGQSLVISCSGENECLIILNYEHNVDMKLFASKNEIMVPFAYSYIISASYSFVAFERAYNSWSARPISGRPGINEYRSFLEGYIDCSNDGKPNFI